MPDNFIYVLAENGDVLAHQGVHSNPHLGAFCGGRHPECRKSFDVTQIRSEKAFRTNIGYDPTKWSQLI